MGEVLCEFKGQILGPGFWMVRAEISESGLEFRSGLDKIISECSKANKKFKGQIRPADNDPRTLRGVHKSPIMRISWLVSDNLD